MSGVRILLKNDGVWIRNEGVRRPLDRCIVALAPNQQATFSAVSPCWLSDSFHLYLKTLAMRLK